MTAAMNSPEHGVHARRFVGRRFARIHWASLALLLMPLAACSDEYRRLDIAPSSPNSTKDFVGAGWAAQVDDTCDAIEAESLERLSAAATAAFKQAQAEGEAHSVCARAGYHRATVQFVPATGGDIRPVHDVRCRSTGNGNSWDCQYFKSERILLVGKRGVTFGPSIDERTVRNAAEFLMRRPTSVPVPRCGPDAENAPVSQYTAAQLATVRRIYLDFDGSLNAHLAVDHIQLERERVASGEEIFRIVCWFAVVV